MRKICITLPDGFELNLEESTKKNIVVEKIIYPCSWEEYCRMYNGKGYWVVGDSSIVSDTFISPVQTDFMRKVLPTRLLATQFIAYMQLVSLRQQWIHIWSHENKLLEDWKLTNSDSNYSIIYFHDDRKCEVVEDFFAKHPLVFPDYHLAYNFRNAFADLLEQAKGLY